MPDTTPAAEPDEVLGTYAAGCRKCGWQGQHYDYTDQTRDAQRALARAEIREHKAAPQVVLGQVGEHVEPVACRDCGKSASACGLSGSFCCKACAGQPGVRGTSFLTHEPSTPPAVATGDADV